MQKHLFLLALPLLLLAGCQKELAFTDFESKTPEGKTVKLSHYVGKGNYVVLNFWASWCPPCRARMPRQVDLYAKYQEERFEIVGYSLDKTNEDWKNGIRELGMTWPQMSDLSYWQSAPLGDYGVPTIPHLVLFDPDGNVIGEGLSLGDLERKLTEIFGY